MQIIYECRKNDLFLQVNHNYTLEWPLHQHYYIEIVYTVKGTNRLQYVSPDKGTVTVDVKAGELLFLFPNIPHAYLARHEMGESDFYVITFAPNINDHFHKLFITQNLEIPLLSLDQLHEDVSYILNKFIHRDIVEQPKGVLDAYITILLERLLPAFRLTKCPSGSSQHYSCDNDAVRIMNYVHDHFCEDISLDTLSAETGANKYNISRFFSQKMQTNLRAYINSLRIELARKALTTTDENITSIMMDCGYQNQQVFNRNFKKVFGISPSKYRSLYTHPSIAASDAIKNGTVYYEQINSTQQALYLQGNYKFIEPIIIPGRTI